MTTRPFSLIADDLDRLSAELRAIPVTYTPHTTAEFTTAVTAAKAGDTILLDPGVRYVLGEYTLGAKLGTVTIRSSAVLPERRIAPADAPLLPILASGQNTRVINGTGAANWKFDGIQFEATANGAGEVVSLQDASNITFDRVLIVGGVNGQKRAIKGNGKNITLTRSHIANVWAYGQDSQAFCAWDGAGPYTITDNYLEAASENIMFGGADSQSNERVPADILVEGNTFTKRDEWRGQGKAVKNLLELKAARRIVIRNNTFSNNWTDAQNGYAWLVKSANQNGTAPWTSTEDVLFENNTLTGSENGINVQGWSSENPGGHTARVTFRGNLLQVTGTAVQAGGEIYGLTLDRNTFQNGYTFLYLYGSTYAVQNLSVTNNLANHNAYGVKGDGTGIGTPTLTRYAQGYGFTQNVLLGGAGKGTYPAETWYDLASVPAGVLVGR